MEIYTLSFQDTFLGTLTVDPDTGMYAFEPDSAGVAAVKEKTVLTSMDALVWSIPII